ncbi:hypothetical protein Salat_1892700 [Sesamum alatum]|uniref:Uncharacterized protein n=1 Tax=Sesamum alatum TaxID=300844 RepID=A0AAE1Y3I9_9LAMI|nr:hypothetical protein Salat_1892700 [Sesamum alatum]
MPFAADPNIARTTPLNLPAQPLCARALSLTAIGQSALSLNTLLRLPWPAECRLARSVVSSAEQALLGHYAGVILPQHQKASTNRVAQAIITPLKSLLSPSHKRDYPDLLQPQFLPSAIPIPSGSVSKHSWCSPV